MAKTYHYTEDSFEQAILELLSEKEGYTKTYGPDLEMQSGRDLSNPLIDGDLEEALLCINKSKPQKAVSVVIARIRGQLSQPLLAANIQMTEWMQGGIDVTFKTKEGITKSDHLKLIDYEDTRNNIFRAVNQWTVINGQHTKRADIVLFVNGLPFCIIELKSPSRNEVDVHDAYLQIENYKRQVPQLFACCQMCVISDMFTTKAGTITATEDRYMEWKTTDGSYENTAYADFETFFQGLFNHKRLLDIIGDFTLTMNQKYRILAGYHQYFAVKKAMECTRQALKRNDGKIGVFWHTQGSGKSLSMVFYAHQLIKNLLSATILVLTDRLDLNDQLHTTFAACSEYLRQTPVKAKDGDELYTLLEKRKANGIIFANIQKFKDRTTPITTRNDVIVLSDEAHRTQSSTNTKVDAKTGEMKIGFAAIVRKLLPNAAFIGFTGTPIEQSDHDTRDVFGNYIDIYDMTQAVEDGATVPVYYESRLIKLDLDAETLEALDAEYDHLADEGAEEEDIKRSKQENAQLHALLRAPKTIDTLCRDIVQHYEDNRQNQLTGKAMIVALDRPTGIEIYKKLIEIRPAWKESIAVVMTQGNQDPAEWNDIIGSAPRKEQLARDFKDDNSKFKIAIVVDMWLTGFDVPSLATMYVYKPMKGHNLMQAIARVNRVFSEKSGGLIVDYIGIAQALKKAMHDYTGRDKQRFGDPDIKKTAYEEFKIALKKCRECLKGYDYSEFAKCSNSERPQLIREGLNIILDPKNLLADILEKHDEKSPASVGSNQLPAQQVFANSSKRLQQATSLCRSLLSESEKYEEAYMEAIRTLLLRLANNGKMTKKLINERITELLKVAVKADGVIEIINAKGEEFSLFDPEFLKELANMKEKNVALELLKKLLKEHIKKHQRTNMTEAEKFSDMLDNRLAAYLKGLISNEEVIKELLQMARDISAHKDELDKLGFTEEERAFYDALTKPQAVKDCYKNDELVNMTKELTETLKNCRILDWRQKESARAKMRSIVKRLLKKYNYPPKEAQGALETVIKQVELWSDEVMMC